MTHSPSTDFSPFPQPVRRRHRDPAGLWSRVWSGSVVLHGLLLLALLPTLKTAIEQATGGSDATPIELVDIGAIATSSESGETTAPAAPIDAAQAPIAPAAPPPAPAAAPPAPAPVPPAAIPPAVLAPSPTPEIPTISAPVATPIPAPSLQTPLPSTAIPSVPAPVAPPVQPSPFVPPVPPPTAERSPMPSPLPFPNNPDQGQPGSSTDLPNQPESNPTGESDRPNDSPSDGSDVAANPAPGAGVPNTGDPTSGSEAGSGDDLGEVVVGRQPSPTNLTLSVVNVRYLSPEETDDIPEQNAELLTDSISVVADPTQPGSCPLFPDGVPDFGAPVTLRLTVEADGRVSRAELQRSDSGNYVYTELVQCLAQQGLQFSPAQDSGIARPSDNTLVEVTVVGG